ncbi:MAG: molybdate ABC transporter permease subunit [Bacteroidota bacterium]
MDWNPIWLSLKLALITTVILLVLGLPIAYWLSKKSSLLKLVLEALFTMPLVLPPSVLGFYLLLAFNPGSTLGKFLQKTFDLQLVFSFPGLIVASVIYSLPFMISPVKAAFNHLPRSISQASFTMGKSEMQTFFKILVPNIRYSLLTATVITFAHTLGEFGVVLMIGGNIPGVTKTASIAIYDAVEGMDYRSAGNYALLLFAISFSIIIAVFVLNRKSAKGPMEW